MTATTAEPFVITRVLNAPRKLVWDVFTRPEHMKEWFGPKGFARGATKMDFRPGGLYHYSLTAPDGTRMWGRFVYREIVPPEKIVFISSFSDEKAGLTRHPMSPTWPIEMLSVFTFEDAGNGKTKLTITWTPYNATPEEIRTFIDGRASMQQGWSGTLEQLEAYLPKLQ